MKRISDEEKKAFEENSKMEKMENDSKWEKYENEKKAVLEVWKEEKKINDFRNAELDKQEEKANKMRKYRMDMIKSELTYTLKSSDAPLDKMFNIEYSSNIKEGVKQDIKDLKALEDEVNRLFFQQRFEKINDSLDEEKLLKSYGEKFKLDFSIDTDFDLVLKTRDVQKEITLELLKQNKLKVVGKSQNEKDLEIAEEKEKLLIQHSEELASQLSYMWMQGEKAEDIIRSIMRQIAQAIIRNTLERIFLTILGKEKVVQEAKMAAKEGETLWGIVGAIVSIFASKSRTGEKPSSGIDEKDSFGGTNYKRQTLQQNVYHFNIYSSDRNLKKEVIDEIKNTMKKTAYKKVA